MAKLFRLPKFIQMEIGKALIANASEEFERKSKNILLELHSL